MNFELGQKVKICYKVNHMTGNKKLRIMAGTIYQITKNFVVIQFEKYKESFKFIDFITGDVKVS